MSQPRTKDFLREQFKKVRSQVPPDLAEAASQGVWAILSKRPEFDAARHIGAFFSVGTEINTYPILEGILQEGKKLYLPRLVKDQNRFDFVQVADFEHLSPGPFGIQEPSGGHPTATAELDLVLVPGLAFDPRGHRLGFGLGFYDRVLPHLRPGALSLGVGYGFQMVEHLPEDPHDIPLKALLTEKGFIYRKEP
ncbi:MAG TPA: 5-formyltetrahydrofolate cyclo-ligase [bacterium]|nr:5-formyltetrahydrofolate cyclo-ligase [bacterium]